MSEREDFDELFRETVLEHYRKPRNHGRLDSPTAQASGMNPVCGDEIHIDVALDADRIAAVGFDGQGCSISQSSASMLTERVRGHSATEALAVAQAFRAMMQNGRTPETDLGDLEALEGVARFPARVKCALLSCNVLEEALGQAARR